MPIPEAIAEAIASSTVVSFFQRFFGGRQPREEKGVNDQAEALYEHLPEVISSRAELEEALDEISFDYESRQDGVWSPTHSEQKSVNFS